MSWDNDCRFITDFSSAPDHWVYSGPNCLVFPFTAREKMKNKLIEKLSNDGLYAFYILFMNAHKHFFEIKNQFC